MSDEQSNEPGVRPTQDGTAIVFATEQEADAFRKKIMAAGLRWCRPIYWHDRAKPFPKTLTGASCFFLKFQKRIVGVTAAHVIRKFEEFRGETPSVVCQLGLVPFHLGGSIIDIDDDLDIATFSISARGLERAQAQAFDVSIEWPPHDAVRKNAVIQLVGYPENIRIINCFDRSGLFQALGGVDFVHHFTDRDIFVVYDPENVKGAPTKPPLGFNMSGSSGGIAVIHKDANLFWPVGVIVGGPLGQGEGDAASFDVITVRRIDCITEDGRIHRPDHGWLPPAPRSSW